MTITIENVDLALLNSQKLALVDMLIGNADSEVFAFSHTLLWGLVEMLDNVYDRYGVEE